MKKLLFVCILGLAFGASAEDYSIRGAYMRVNERVKVNESADETYPVGAGIGLRVELPWGSPYLQPIGLDVVVTKGYGGIGIGIAPHKMVDFSGGYVVNGKSGAIKSYFGITGNAEIFQKFWEIFTNATSQAFATASAFGEGE